MKMIIKLILIYIGSQIIGSLLALPVFLFADKTTALSTGLIFSSLLMIGYLWKQHYLRIDNLTWSVGPKHTFLWLIPFTLGGYFLATYANEVLHLPNLMEDQFVDMSLNVVGVLGIVLIGPVAEEFLFRGAIMNYLFGSELYPWFLPVAMVLVFSSTMYLKKLKSPEWKVQPDEEPGLEGSIVINEESK